MSKYQKAYGIIETLAPLHVGASAGEETGNLNLIFRDQFTQTGIIPGSSIRGRLRSEMEGFAASQEDADDCYGRPASKDPEKQEFLFESRIKMEHASIVWLPLFCPGQPIVWVSCPRLLRRYQRMAGEFVRVNENQLLKDIKDKDIPSAYTGSHYLNRQQVFFNFGFVRIEHSEDLSAWFPLETMFGYPDSKKLPAVVVDDNDMAMIHDMALYRQSRVALRDDQKVVANQAFFNVEALPEGTILAFPIAIKPPVPSEGQSKQNQAETEEVQTSLAEEASTEVNPQTVTSSMAKKGYLWKPFKDGMEGNIYLGGLESVGFGHCYLTVKVPESKSSENS